MTEFIAAAGGSMRKDSLSASITFQAPDGFTLAATASFFTAARRYMRDLERCSRDAARRSAGDMVSKYHVTRAARYLATGRPTGWTRAAGAVGGLSLGTALGQWLDMIATGSFSAVGVSVTLALSVLGTGGLLHQLFRD